LKQKHTFALGDAVFKPTNTFISSCIIFILSLKYMASQSGVLQKYKLVSFSNNTFGDKKYFNVLLETILPT